MSALRSGRQETFSIDGNYNTLHSLKIDFLRSSHMVANLLVTSAVCIIFLLHKNLILIKPTN